MVGPAAPRLAVNPVLYCPRTSCDHFGPPGGFILQVYAQEFAVEVIVGGKRRLCPLDWLDSFCMRNFTASAEFDDTLPLADGLIEAGFRVSPERLAAAMSGWFTGRGKGE